jgi:glyoxylase-like metal-dependent hydrolase (beta-lactamase superfamily II)
MLGFERRGSVRVHHLNCGSFQLLAGEPPVAGARPVGVTHCLLAETGDGLLLVDTGFGLRDCLAPTPFVRLMTALGRCARDPEETAVRQVARLGYAREDVRHIVLTHCHYDHAGGLPDFPQARVHIYADEYQAVIRPRGASERMPYRREHWAHSPHWAVHALAGERWFGLPCTPAVDLGTTQFALVPLPGHTRGHSGVTLRVGDGWLFHSGDAYIYHGEVDPAGPFYPRRHRLQRALFSLNPSLRQVGKHAARLRALAQAHGDQVHLLCSHDAWYLGATVS